MTEPRQVSYGRGGAGNIAPAAAVSPPDPKDLVTPTIKAQVYTTGRGGAGNMASNENPDIARASQDVEAPPPVKRGSADERPVTMLGRGGAGNANYQGGEQSQGSEPDLEAGVQKPA